jgi:nucleotide-binding universal stress UspA family protein
MSKVVAAIDNSATARPVLVAATALARVLGADVNAICVAEDEGQTARRCANGLRVPLTILTGDPFRQIEKRALADDVFAVVIGARRRVNERRIGHMARAVANQITKPVLVVPPEAIPAERLRTVLIAMKGTPATPRGIKAVVDVAAGADLEVVVVHVDDEASIPSFSDQAAHETDAYTEEFLARYVHGAPKARLELRVGVPADEILAATVSITADLLALGWPQSTDEDRGAVAREVLDRSHVPVLLVALADIPKTRPDRRHPPTPAGSPE